MATNSAPFSVRSDKGVGADGLTRHLCLPGNRGESARKD